MTQNGGWERVPQEEYLPPAVKFSEEGQEVSGWYAGTREVNVGGRVSRIHQLLQEDGAIVDIWGTAELDGFFARCPLRMLVRIVYRGMQGQRKTFEIYRRPSVPPPTVPDDVPF